MKHDEPPGPKVPWGDMLRALDEQRGEAVAEPSREAPELDSPHFTPEQQTYAARIAEALSVGMPNRAIAIMAEERMGLEGRILSLEREIAEKDENTLTLKREKVIAELVWTRLAAAVGCTSPTGIAEIQQVEYIQELLQAAEARVALLEEKLAQFDAYGMPNVAAALNRVAALEKERDEWKAKHKLLGDAVNESDLPCLPGCDRYAHEEDCPHISMAASLSELQRQKTKAEKEARALKESLGAIIEAMRGANPNGWCTWIEDTMRVGEALLSAGEHDQE